MITVPQFRADFPEFSSTATYTNSAVGFWLGISYQLLNANRWGTMLDLAAELFTAHNMAIEARATAEVKGGGLPGSNTGPIERKKVDKVEVTYAAALASIKDGGNFNLTNYGTRFLYLVSMFGAGPVQIGIGVSPLYNNSPWSGPDVTPGFSNFS